MKLSIVIVNYNVKYFLEQCLLSVREAAQHIEHEVFVVDNASSDDSLEMLKKRFPEVHLIANDVNLGFSKANNQAIRESTGEYILLLNPDTVVQNNTFSVCLDFMDHHTDAGAIGVKMLDGKGNFLPESKRGLPTPWVSFYKIFGLSSLFPRSPKFARYHLGHLDENENHPVDVLAGAFMMMRREALDKAGLLDEDFFMYGEDIDLSYRITKAGYQNYYLADTSIIHYKGESTKKGSLNYVYVFYKAMAIFARKHFSGTYASVFNLAIRLAIYLRAGISVVRRIVYYLSVPVVDAGILLLGLHYIKEYWEHNHRFIVGGEYSPQLIWTAFPLYTAAWLISIFISGGYERPAKLSNLLKGVFTGTLIILVGYSLVDESYRFSRAIIILGFFWALVAAPLWRWLVQKISGVNLLATAEKHRRLVIVGREKEGERVAELVRQSNVEIAYLAFVSPDDKDKHGSSYVGSLSDLPEIVRVFDLDEVIFCSRDIPGEKILSNMALLNPIGVEIKIAPSESEFVIGSNSIDARGSWYTVQFNDLSRESNQLAKRLADMLMAGLGILLFPILFFIVKRPGNYFMNCFRVLGGKLTWVGYDERVDVSHLPALRRAVLPVSKVSGLGDNNLSAIKHINQLYARDYQVSNDLQFILSGIRQLGNRVMPD